MPKRKMRKMRSEDKVAIGYFAASTLQSAEAIFGLYYDTRTGEVLYGPP